MSTTVLLAVSLLASSSSAGAQHPGANDDQGRNAKGLRRRERLGEKAAELVPADEYGYKPVQTERTFGQLVAHVVDSDAYFCAQDKASLG